MAAVSGMSGHCFEGPFGVSGMYAKWYMWSVVCRISVLGSIVCMVSGM